MLMEVCAKFITIVPTLTHDAEISLTTRELNRVNDNGLLHAISYVTLYEYLCELRHCCEMLSDHNPMVIRCLADSISDY